MNEQLASRAFDQRKVATPFKDGRHHASELIAHWPSDKPFEVSAVLRDAPELQNHKSALVVLAYEEYCRRTEAGQEIGVTDFVNRFPMVHRALLRQLAVHRWLGEHLSLYGDLSPVQWPQENDTIAGFQLIEELGRGAFSRVFLATETELGDRLVAVKVCLSGNREADALGKLQHPHVVPVHSVQTDDATGLVVICMPFLGRVTLFDVMDFAFADETVLTHSRVIEDAVRSQDCVNVPLDEANAGKSLFRRESYVNGAIRIGLQLAEALEFTHGHGFCHCDIKPSNVLITSAGIAKLLDFNLSFHVQSDKTNVGGTIPYMAPEQLRAMLNRNDGSPSEIDQRADLFAFGVVMYELLCGKRPFGELDPQLSSQQIAEVLLERQRSGPRPLLKMGVQFDGRLVGVIERCLEFDPAQRIQTAGEVVKSLRSLLKFTARSQRWFQSHRRSSMSVLVMSLAVFSGMTYHVATREPFSVRQQRSGWEAYQQNRFDQAIEHFSRSLDSDPNCIDALFGRGLSQMRSGQYEKALTNLKATAVRVNDGRVSASIAYCLTCLGRERKDPTSYNKVAIRYYRRAIQQGFTPAAVYNNIGFCQMASRDLDLAEENLVEAINRDKRFLPAYYNLASVDRQTAERENRPPNPRHIEAAIQLAPRIAEFHLFAASVYALLARRTTQEIEGDTRTHVDRVCSYCEQAVGCGLDPRRLDEVASFFPSIVQEPRFQALQDSLPPSVTPVEPIRFIDPLAHLSERLKLDTP